MFATRGFLLALVIAGCAPHAWSESGDFRAAATELFPALVVVESSTDQPPAAAAIPGWFPGDAGFRVLLPGRDGAESVLRLQTPEAQRPPAGWVVTDGLILASGIGRSGDVVWVRDQAGERHEGKLVATDHVTKLMAIQTETPLAEGLTISEKPLAAGQPVLAGWLANPDEPIARIATIASGPSPREASLGFVHHLDMHGSRELAGVPLVDFAGELVGFTVAAGQRLACVPASALRPLIESAKSDSPQDLWPGRVGIVFQNGRDSMIREVQASSPAATAGLQVDDRIVAVNDVTTNSPQAVQAAISGFRGGDRVTLTVGRGEEELQLEVVLEADRSVSQADGMAGMPNVFWRYENGELVPFGPEAPAVEELRKRIPAPPQAPIPPMPPMRLRGFEVERSVLEQTIQSLESQLKTLREQQSQLEKQLRSLQDDAADADQ